jgi:hypothetical protein
MYKVQGRDVYVSVKTDSHNQKHTKCWAWMCWKLQKTRHKYLEQVAAILEGKMQHGRLGKCHKTEKKIGQLRWK